MRDQWRIAGWSPGSLAIVVSGVKAASGAPPQEASMTPIGTGWCSRTRARRSRPPPRTSAPSPGSETFQPSVATSASGKRDVTRVARRKRTWGWLARGISAAAPSAASRGHSMFDWPAATQTSPTQTSSRRIVLDALTVRAKGPPAEDAGRWRLHRPRSSATALRLSPRKLAVTVSPGAAWPQRWNGTSRCTTMCSPSTAGSETAASAVPVASDRSAIPRPIVDRVIGVLPPGRSRAGRRRF